MDGGEWPDGTVTGVSSLRPGSHPDDPDYSDYSDYPNYSNYSNYSDRDTGRGRGGRGYRTPLGWHPDHSHNHRAGCPGHFCRL